MSFRHPAAGDGILGLTEDGFQAELLDRHWIDQPCFAAFAMAQLPATQPRPAAPAASRTSFGAAVTA